MPSDAAPSAGQQGPQDSSADADTLRSSLEPDYQLLEELGRGGMAVVYRALERGLDREVAIKVLPPHMTFDAEFVERFQREARTAGQLEHPNIVPIYRVGRSGQVSYFVMKLLRGQSLGAVLRERGKLEVADVRRVLIETGSALGYAARRGVVHRDVKPDNILLDDEGRCVVTDFGIAKTATGPHTAAGISLGTPRYMSPEHAQGTPVDGRSDIYSLGVVAYQCLAGVTPFNADEPFAILYKHINDTLPRPTLETEEERELFRVIERMLAKRPEDRFQSADDVVAALGGDVPAPLADSSGPIARARLTPTVIMSPSVPVNLVQRARNWRTWVIAGGVAALAATGVMAWPGGERAADSAAAAGDSGAAVQAGERADSIAVAAGVRDSGDAPVSGVPPAGAGATTEAVRVAASSVTAAKTTPAQSAARRPAPEPFSMCPRLPAAAASRPQELVHLVDSIGPQRSGAALLVLYDVCGLTDGAEYTVNMTLRKVNQSRLRRVVGAAQDPVVTTFDAKATGPRLRRRRTLQLSGLSGGTYTLTSGIVDARGRRAEASRTFEVIDP